ncbi:hypothetical protein CLAVI_000298 [Candidatus Clavichlamydia salmonicola]|nr:hypothetical protein [Candidatus Clavichlamydia salmonicola]
MEAFLLLVRSNILLLDTLPWHDQQLKHHDFVIFFNLKKKKLSKTCYLPSLVIVFSSVSIKTECSLSKPL